MAVAGETLMLLDNIDRMLGNASLDAALTATSWSDRILDVSYGQRHPAVRDLVCHRQQRHHGRRHGPAHGSYPAGMPARRTPRSAKASGIPTCWLGTAGSPRLAVAALTILAAYCSTDAQT